MMEQINHPIVKNFLRNFGNDDLFQKWESFPITQRFFYSVVKPLFDENLSLRKKLSGQVIIEPEPVEVEQPEEQEEDEDELEEPVYDSEPSFEEELKKEVKKKLTKPQKEKQKRMDKVRELLKDNPDSTSADVMNLIGVTENTALSYLKELEEE